MAGGSLLAEIFKVIADIVSWLAKRTANLICLILLVVAFLIAFWRSHELLDIFSSNGHDFNGASLACFCIAIAELFTASLGLISALSPLRWYHLGSIYNRAARASTNHESGSSMRGGHCSAFILFVCDILSIPFCLMSFLMPTRSIAVISYIAACMSPFSPLGDDVDTYNERVMNAQCICIYSALVGIIDLLVILPGFFGMLLMPSCWWSNFGTLGCLWRCHLLEVNAIAEMPQDRTDSFMEKAFCKYANWNFFLFRLYMLCLRCIPIFFLEFFASIFMILALLSPLRNGPFRAAIRARKEVMAGYLATKIDSLCTELYRNRTLASIFYAEDDVSMYRWRYDGTQRTICLNFGLMSIADLLLIPFLLPLFITQYRYVPIKAQLASVPYWGFDEIFLVVTQASFLFLDLLFLFPTLPIVFASQIRWRPVKAALQRFDGHSSSLSFELYDAAVGNVSLLLLDLLALPGIFILFITGYRFDDVKSAWCTERIWYKPCGFFLTIFCNTALVLFDMIVMVPSTLLVLALGVHRAATVWTFLSFYLCNASTPEEIPPPTFTTNNEINAASRGAVAEGINTNSGDETNEAAEPANSLVTLEGGESQPSPSAESNLSGRAWRQVDGKWTRGLAWSPIDSLSNIRPYILHELCGFFFDIPFSVLGLIVLCTGLRTIKVIKILHAQTKVMAKVRARRDGDWIQSLSTDIQAPLDELRAMAVAQFTFLLRDILCLIPFSLVVASLYRLPGVIIDLYARLAGKPSLDEPLLQVISCRIEFADQGGVMFHLRVSPRSASDDASKNVFFSLKPSVYLTAYSDSFWSLVSDVFGGTVASVGRAMLPLKLDDKKGIGLSEFCDSIRNPIKTEAAGGEAPSADVANEDEGEEPYSMWIKVDMGKTKRTTVAKNITKLDANSRHFVLQLDAIDALTGQKHVLLRFCPSFGEMYNAANKGSANLPWRAFECIAAPKNTVSVVQDVEADATLPTSTRKSRLSSTVRDFQRRLDNTEETSDVEYNGLDSDGGLIDSFHVVVCLAFVQLWLDLIHFLAVCFCLVVNPFRFALIMRDLLENPKFAAYRLATACWRGLRHADVHLLDFRASVAPIVNTLAKSNKDYYCSYSRSRGPPDAFYASGGERICDLMSAAEKDLLKPYQRMSQRVLKSLQGVDHCNALLELVWQRIELHDGIIKNWCARTAIRNKVYQTGTQVFRADAPTPLSDEKYSILVALTTQAQERAAKRLVANTSEIEVELQCIATTCGLIHNDDIDKQQQQQQQGIQEEPKKKKCCSKPGIFHRSLAASRDIIRYHFFRAFRDFLAFLTLFLLLLTLVKLLPIARDLWASGTANPMRYSTRRILEKHVRDLVLDAFILLKFTILLAFLLATVVSVPAFLQAIPSHASSFEEAIDCIIFHLAWTLWYLGELCCLCCACSTYRLALNSAVYAVLLPGACVAEGLPSLSSSDVEDRRLAAAAVAAAARAAAAVVDERSTLNPTSIYYYDSDDEWFGGLLYGTQRRVGGNQTASNSTKCAFFVGTVIWFFLLGCSIATTMAARRAGAVSPYSSTLTLQWTDMCLLGITLLLTIYMAVTCMVVSKRPVYTAPGPSSVTAPGLTWSHILAIVTAPLETIQLAAVVIFFFWSPTPGLDVALGKPSQYGSSMSLSHGMDVFASRVMVWGSQGDGYMSYYKSINVACALVLLWGLMVAAPAAVIEDDEQGRSNIRNNAFYEFLAMLITRIFPVWVMATLMRPVSCIGYASSSSLSKSSVLSTDSSVMCGGDATWSSVGALSLLVYFVITTSVMHTDDAELLNVAKSRGKEGVRFAPLYALQMRAAQFLVCGVSASSFASSNPLAPLIPIIISCFAMAIFPLFYTKVGACSFSAISPMRSAGALSVAWAAIICLVRRASSPNDDGGEPFWANENALFIGWGVCFLIGLLVALFAQRQARNRWLEALQRSGLGAALDSLLQTADTLMVQEALDTKRNLKLEKRVEEFRYKAQSCLSPKDAAFLLASLENSILVDRLSPEFLRSRNEWLSDLLQNHMSVSFGDETPPRFTFARIKHCAESLKAAIIPTAHALNMSRQVLTLLLSRRVPPEIAWAIFDFCSDSTAARVLLSTVLAIGVDKNLRLRDANSADALLARTKVKDVIQSMTQRLGEKMTTALNHLAASDNALSQAVQMGNVGYTPWGDKKISARASVGGGGAGRATVKQIDNPFAAAAAKQMSSKMHSSVLAQLAYMGFPADESMAAIKASNGDLEGALDFLSNGGFRPSEAYLSRKEEGNLELEAPKSL